MLIVVSPAKTLDYETVTPIKESTSFDFQSEAKSLISLLRKYDSKGIQDLMGLSPKLAELNVQRYSDWQLPMDEEASRQSIFAFKGDVYQGLDSYSFTAQNLEFAQKHLRVLSGLYGLLRPLDRMLPYRLEMGTKLVNAIGQDLYSFWGAKISEKLNDSFLEDAPRCLVNLASNEYFKAVNLRKLSAKVVTPQFLDCKNGKFKIISFYAKRARGLMASWIIRNEVIDVEKLSEFDSDGYRYSSERSSPDVPVFIRDER
jgi:uncharacterized protein